MKERIVEKNSTIGKERLFWITLKEIEKDSDKKQYNQWDQKNESNCVIKTSEMDQKQNVRKKKKIKWC